MQFENLDLLERNAGGSLPPPQMVLVVPFLHECVGIFGPELAKKQITMTVNMNDIERLSTYDNDNDSVNRAPSSHFVDPEQWNNEVCEKVRMNILNEKNVTIFNSYSFSCCYGTLPVVAAFD